MSSTATIAATRTFTVVDIRRVVDRFGADYDMIIQATGLRSQGHADDVIADVKAFAEAGYLARVDVVLQNARGQTVRAARYEVSKHAHGWTGDRPGGCLWPRLLDGCLSVVVSYTSGWWSLPTKAAFLSSLRISWVPSDIDISYPGLSGIQDRRYTSNGYGMARTTFVA